VADAAEGLSSVQGYFYDWRDQGLFKKINFWVAPAGA
jgi:hypothetical protein